MRRRSVASLFACLLSLGACGGAEQVVRREPLPPLTEEQAVLFDDGVDLIEDPAALEGRWYEDWQQELERRLAEADEVALGKVQTVRADVDLSRRTSYRVVFTVEHAFKGDPGNELTLSVRDSALGYASVERNRERLLQRTFVAFIKRAGSDDGLAVEVPHFHLTPPSAPLDKRLERFEADQRPNTIKIIEHEQRP
jgi:hypothetical protein